MTADPLVCAVDIGTSSVRAAFVDPAGRSIHERRVARRDAAAQFDADQLWHDVVGVLAALTSDAPGVVPLSLAISGHVGAVVLDTHGRPLVRAGGWSDERGLTSLRRRWQQAPDAWARSGRVTATGGALALLAGLTDDDPGTASQVRHVMAPKDYINLRLTGEYATDVTSAAYSLGLDIAQVRWDGELVASVGFDPAVLPALSGAADTIGRLTADAAGDTGLPLGLPVAAGGPDGTVGAAAIVGTDPEMLVDIAGTTDVLVRVEAAPANARSSRTIVNPYVVPGRWSRGGPTGMTGGSVSHWVDLLCAGSSDAAAALLRDAISQVSPGAEGLYALPHLTGSRFPVWRDDEAAALAGMRPAHTPSHIVRAVHEGAAFAVRQALDVLDPTRAIPVLLAGGVSRSPELVQLRADITGRVIRTRTAPDASLIGAARLAQLNARIFTDLDTPRDAAKAPGMDVRPNPSMHQRYDEAYARWTALRRAVLAVDQRASAHH